MEWSICIPTTSHISEFILVFVGVGLWVVAWQSYLVNCTFSIFLRNTCWTTKLKKEDSDETKTIFCDSEYLTEACPYHLGGFLVRLKADIGLLEHGVLYRW